MAELRKLKHGDYFVLLGLLLVVVGFTPTFFLKPFFGAGKPLTQLIFVHGVTTTAWIALFAHQYFSASRGALARHRLIGISGAALFGLFIAFSLVEVIARVQLAQGAQGVKPLLALAFPFWVIVETLIFGTTAFFLVRRPDWHRQLQLAGFFVLIAPATARALRLVFPAGPSIVYASLVISLALYIGATRWHTTFKQTDKLSKQTNKLILNIVFIQLFFILLIFLSLHEAPLWLQFASALTGDQIP